MRYFLILLFALLTACGSSAPTVKPFKMDIQQGNVVTSKMLLQLRPGMTKSQVRFIMGTPLIVDSFHKDRWDYFYQLRQAGKIVEQRRVILDFDKDLLSKVRGDVVPQGTAGAATGADAVTAKSITVEPKPKEKSMLDKLKFWEKDEPAKELAKPISPEASKPAPTEAAPITNADVPAADTPSILAVPIDGALTPDTTIADTPKPETQKPETPTAEEPVITSPVVAVPQAAPMPAEPVPTNPSPKQDEKLIFRMDRNLDLKNLETAPAEAAPAEIKAKSKKVEQPVPAEEEPGYFERMLEKIGF